ncbi:hypothetical protein NB636_01170 [Oxalobacter aliiformigenes]|uniref:hypothetical protein n=1 Tax=Oxalobacter aliiformigenes TaxID=2946593 RepID=UPI0022AFD28C|nr:hypothetical protein [Oxalobacter aliiformigenes]MCZ4064126.1 hypothetical protein [Oxalobacter aliiformigenes]WAV99502.1 hypothetical protein NB636_01170 [Oxalobacter aliiformigenes]
MKDEADKKPVFEQLLCPKCNHRLGDAAGKEYVVALHCRRCNKIATFKKMSGSY